MSSSFGLQIAPRGREELFSRRATYFQSRWFPKKHMNVNSTGALFKCKKQYFAAAFNDIASSLRSYQWSSIFSVAVLHRFCFFCRLWCTICIDSIISWYQVLSGGQNNSAYSAWIVAKKKRPPVTSPDFSGGEGGVRTGRYWILPSAGLSLQVPLSTAIPSFFKK